MCENSSVLSMLLLVKNFLDLITIFIPIILIMYTVIDLVRNQIDVNKKYLIVIGKRFLFAILIFLVPTIVSLIVNNLDEENKYLSCYKEATTENIKYYKAREEAEKKNQQNNSSNVDPNLCGAGSCTGTATFDPEDLTKASNLTVSELTLTITKYAEGRDPRVKNFIPLAPAFIKAEKDHRINAIGIMSIDAHESGWASERLARLCNNLGGYRGKGTRPCSVSNHEGGFSGYNSKEEFIDKQASKLKTNYLTPGGKYFNGKGLSGIAQKYLTTGKDHWINNISKIGTTMAKKAKEVTGR